MEILDKITLFMYFVTLIGAILAAIIFKASRRGPFRSQFILFFISLAWALNARFLDIAGIYDVHTFWAMLPLCPATVLLVYRLLTYDYSKPL